MASGRGTVLALARFGTREPMRPALGCSRSGRGTTAAFKNGRVMSTLLIVILVVLLLGGGGAFYGGRAGWGGSHYGGLVGLIVVILLVLFLTGSLR